MSETSEPMAAGTLAQQPSPVTEPGLESRRSRSDAAAPPAPSLHQKVIQRETVWRIADFPELWHYRDLIWILASRDLKARYRQSILGAFWYLLQPLVTLLIYVVFFKMLRQTPTVSGVPYVVSLLCGLLAWNFFAAVLSSSANSLPANAHLINKVYCPPLVFPLASAVVALSDLLIALVLTGAALAYFRVAPGWPILLLPLFIVMSGLVALAAGLWIAALSARYRDMRFTIPVLIQVWFFASPVVYEAGALIPQRIRFLYNLNPMSGILGGMRWALTARAAFSWNSLAVAGPATLVCLLLGLIVFRRVGRTLPDYL